MSIGPTQLAVEALRDYLLAYLPAKVAELNALRLPTLQTPVAGPFTIPAGAKLVLSTDRESAGTVVTLTSGSRTAAQVATDITTAAPAGITAAADVLGRLVLTGTTAPSTTAGSYVLVLPDDQGTGGAATGSNEALGWDPGGELDMTSSLRAPGLRGVCDGWPVTAPDMGQGFWVIIDNRVAEPAGGVALRRNLWDVTLSVLLAKPELFESFSRDREGINWVMRAVKECILTTDGRYLGREASGDVMGLEVTKEEVAGMPIEFKEVPNALYDTAALTVRVRVFAPSSS